MGVGVSVAVGCGVSVGATVGVFVGVAVGVALGVAVSIGSTVGVMVCVGEMTIAGKGVPAGAVKVAVAPPEVDVLPPSRPAKALNASTARLIKTINPSPASSVRKVPRRGPVTDAAGAVEIGSAGKTPVRPLT